MKSHKYTYGKRVINWRTFVISATILWCAVAGSHSDYDNTYVREPDVFMKPVVVQPEPTIEDKIKEYFPRSWRTMIAVAHAESSMNHNAQNWNCWYNKDQTIVYPSKVKGSHSTSCKKSHRHLSWSMDCGVLMKNYIGVKECPVVDVDTHLKEMAELSKKRGFQPWYAWSNGSYKKFLASK